ncbi:MAG: carboxypeptidase-like regulatory domain-containing protein [Vicinamibacterales bacterium]
MTTTMRQLAGVLALSVSVTPAYAQVHLDGGAPAAARASGVTAGIPTTSLRGTVTDASGAALPGVTVTVASSATSGLATVTDARGDYRFDGLAAGTYTIRFELGGFETATVERAWLRAGDALVLDRELALATLTETVTVQGAAPLQAPALAPAPFIVRRPEPVHVPAEALASVCGPGQPDAASTPLGRLAAHRDQQDRKLYGPGDILVLDRGADAGLEVGQNLVVRRQFRTGQIDPRATNQRRAKGIIGDLRYRWQDAMRAELVGEHSAGLVQVVEADAAHALAVVVYACDEFVAGDYVAPFEPTPVVRAQASVEPNFDDAARILHGDEGQTIGGPSRMMVIDRGATGGAEPGQRLVLFRRALGDRGPISEIGDGIVVAVKAETATIRIDRAVDAVFVGDRVAMPHHRP